MEEAAGGGIMDFELGSKYRYEYRDLPDVKGGEDVASYIREAKKIFPTCKKKPKRVKLQSFDNPIAQKNWEMEEIRRCIEGHDGMSGKMYFYYNFCFIKNISGGIIRPQFRAPDALWFHLLEAVGYSEYLSGQGLICLKRRRSGFSWKEACDMLHDALFTIGANVGMTSKSERDAQRLFGWVQFMYEKLPGFLKAPMSSQSKEHITFARKSKNKNGNRELSGHQSTMYSVAPTDGCFEGDMLTKMIIDEVGKITNVLTIWAMGQDVLMEETERKGIPILFGTAGEQDGNGIGQREFWLKHKSYDLTQFFFPGWAGMFCDENGNDDIERAVKWILDTRKQKLESGASDYWDFVQKYPLTVRDALLMKNGVGIGNMKKIKDQEYELDKSPAHYKKGTFRWGLANEPTVVFIPNTVYDNTGECRIYEHPKGELQYASGADPADHDYVSAGASDLSLYIMSKQRGTRPPRMTFSLTYRPEKVNDFYEQAIMALVYYNETKTLIENNRNGMIQYFQNNGYIHLLKPEPQPKNVFNVQQSKRLGIRKTVQSTKEMERCINHYTDDYAHLIPEVELLAEFMVYGQENTDRAIAFGWTLVSLEDETVNAEEQDRIANAAPTWRFKKINGRIVRVKK